MFVYIKWTFNVTKSNKSTIKGVEEQKAADEDVCSWPEYRSHCNLVLKETTYQNSYQRYTYFNSENQQHTCSAAHLSNKLVWI